MSQWCNKCNRVPYDSNCNHKCPVFGLEYENLAKKYLAALNANQTSEDKIYATDEELIGILGQLLDDNETDVKMSEKVRQGIYEVYSALVARENNW